ncbi:hypothetical protein PInf_025398 [Phytophthora infestans]|nr:hypothetical protein PInf_025398 [Phytophthora infestans]
MALPRVHRGFWLAYESIQDELKEVTRLILDENPGISVYITGHSMGGALAVIAAYDLAVNFSIKVNMYNFGGPRVGNPSFRQHYDSCVPTSYRVVMDGDIVPGWPRFWGLYQHVGTEISLDVSGNLIVDPSFRAQEGVIRSHIDLAEAAANGSRGMVDFLLDNGMQIDTPGKDGTTPLCAAALWGNDAMVAFLLDKGADVSARNEGTGWTALHAASFQEHGKVVRILLVHKADPKMVDVEGRRAVDYASISEAIWPFFAAQGHTKSLKSDLVAKGIIRKIQEQPEEVQLSDKHESISSFSRPGSAYIRAQMYPPHARRQSPAIKSRDGRILTGPIDPLGDMPSELESNQRGPSLKRLGI